jgi:hypothetical protein
LDSGGIAAVVFVFTFKPEKRVKEDDGYIFYRASSFLTIHEQGYKE